MGVHYPFQLAVASSGLVVVIALGGCQSTGTGSPPPRASMAGAERSCIADNARYAEAWACIKGRIEAGDIVLADPRYSDLPKFGDRLLASVQSGAITDADARWVLRNKLPVE